MNIPSSPFSITNTKMFNEKCMEIFYFQAKYCGVYRDYLAAVNIQMSSVKKVEDIPFMPISFFKNHEISCMDHPHDLLFKSSGTGGDRSIHHVFDKELYEMSFISSFIQSFGRPEDYVIMALLPNYLEQGESSLVYMVDHLIKLSKNKLSGFYLEGKDNIIKKILEIEKSNKVLLIGVTYALLDAVEKEKVSLKNTVVIETGGMKGRRREMIREELQIGRAHV